MSTTTLLTPSGPSGYGARQVRRTPIRRPFPGQLGRDIDAAVACARAWRARLGLGPTPAPDDSWALAEALGDGIHLRRSPLPGGRCRYTRSGRSFITLPEQPESAWRQAHILAHELGHHLLTQCSPEVLAYFDGHQKVPSRWERESELIAEAFARAFIGPHPGRNSAIAQLAAAGY